MRSDRTMNGIKRGNVTEAKGLSDKKKNLSCSQNCVKAVS